MRVYLCVFVHVGGVGWGGVNAQCLIYRVEGEKGDSMTWRWAWGDAGKRVIGCLPAPPP